MLLANYSSGAAKDAAQVGGRGGRKRNDQKEDEWSDYKFVVMLEPESARKKLEERSSANLFTLFRLG